MKKWQVMICAGLLLSAFWALPSHGEGAYGAYGNPGHWIEKTLYMAEDGSGYETGQKSSWYYQAPDGTLDTGWALVEGHWYFLNPADGPEKGRMMTGWQWIDGRCYYLAETEASGYPLGAMYAGTKTPDGYEVGGNGAWLKENGAEWYIPGKGLSSVREDDRKNKPGVAKRVEKYAGSGGGSGGGGGSGNGGGSGGGGNEPGDVTDEWETSTPKDDSGSEDNRPGGTEEEGRREENEGETDPATPSVAKKVKWEVSFVDEEDQNREIFRSQHGETAEGTELSVDFPERIEGKDGWIYQALEGSPKRITVAGTGLQKYAVLFRKEDRSVEEPEPEDEKERLDGWIQAAEAADREITGEGAEGWQIITASQEESRERLLNLVSMVNDGARHEVYLIARNHNPSTVAIGQEFSDVTGISELVMDEFVYLGEYYRIVRVGFQRTWKEDSCIHDMEIKETAAAGCISEGHERYCCRRCGYEETVFFPAAGHRDEGGDGVCDVCFMDLQGEGVPGGILFREGYIQVRNIGGKAYRFRCIDEDYSDDKDNRGYAALFLCETVIRSDVETGSQTTAKMTFGADNNYKTSNVRTWLREKTEAPFEDISYAYTGVNTAYLGATGKGEYEQFTFDRLQEYDKPFQMMEDRMFILSLEEAVKYRDFLWKFNGSARNNPQSQYSPYSRGYYLRTPQYEGGKRFQYGAGIYAVDLFDGSIHPVDSADTSVGIRPAYVISQNRE